MHFRERAHFSLFQEFWRFSEFMTRSVLNKIWVDICLVICVFPSIRPGDGRFSAEQADGGNTQNSSVCIFAICFPCHENTCFSYMRSDAHLLEICVVISLVLEAGLCVTWSQDSEGQLHYELLLYLL